MSRNDTNKIRIWMTIMFIASFVAMFFIDKDHQWWAMAHFVISFIGIIVLTIADICDHSK